MTVVSGTLIAYVNVSEGSTLTLRKGPTTGSSAVLQMARNTPVYVLGYNSEWARVRTLFGTTGYVAVRYLRFSSDKTPTTPAPTPTPEAPSMTVVSGTKYGYVIKSGLPMYENAIQTASVLGTITYGERVRVYAYNNTWCYAEYYGVKGYLPMYGLSTKNPNASSSSSSSSSPPSSSPANHGFTIKDTGIVFCQLRAVTTAKVNMRKSYSTSSAVIRTLPRNTVVAVGAYNQNWAYVSYGGKKGFIQLKYLQRIS